MLIGNYQTLNRTPGRFLAGSVLAENRCNFNGPGASRNFQIQDMTSTAYELAGIPSGTEPPYSWVIPQTGGALASFTMILGAGNLTAGMANGLACVAALTGTGDIGSASVDLIVSLASSIFGTGDITTASIQTFLTMSASLTGSGDIGTAVMSALANLAGGLTGTGDVTTAVVNGPASMSASITVTGELLTTANAAEIIWQRIIKNGYTAEEALRMMAAVSLGKSSGNVVGSPSTVLFSEMGGTSTQVEGTIDSNGNRTSVTLTPG